MARKWFWILFFISLPLPWIFHTWCRCPAAPLVTALLTGSAIIAASFILSWIAEVAQLDIPQSVALAAVALIAVLPEYAVDMYFAWMAGKNAHYAPYALANMTGSNRLLIGGGWAFVVFLFYLRSGKKEISMKGENAVEITSLIIATLYSLVIPLKGTLCWYDAVIFIGIFVFYIWNATRCGLVEPEITGPPELIAALPARPRRLALLSLFAYAGFVIFISAAPFAESLIATGRLAGIDEFILVQWVAPIASESPEFILATLFALHGFPAAGIGCLVSSKVNQWTLLVGMLPLVFMLSAGKLVHLALDPRQTEEVFLTTAQSLFALALISRLRINVTHALILFILFVTQLFITHPMARWLYAAVYFAWGLGLYIFDGSRKENVRGFFSKACRIPE